MKITLFKYEGVWEVWLDTDVERDGVCLAVSSSLNVALDHATIQLVDALSDCRFQKKQTKEGL